MKIWKRKNVTTYLAIHKTVEEWQEEATGRRKWYVYDKRIPYHRFEFTKKSELDAYITVLLLSKNKTKNK